MSLPVSYSVKVGPSSISGSGLFATTGYQEGYVLGFLDGPVVAFNEATDNAVEPIAGVYIETQPPFVYANHSCCPNVELIGQRVVVAKRNILPGEELFFDYSTFIHDNWSMTCDCGNSNCRRQIQAYI